ncbi:hypothetical protein KQI65_05215 [bacterium]|nr:hypothetical protein [bacterium]
MRTKTTFTLLWLSFTMIFALFPREGSAQFGHWEAVTDVQAGYAAHMLDLGDGRFLFSGPSSRLGRNGRGLYLYTPGESMLKDVTPSWGKVHALAWANDRSILCANDEGIWRTKDFSKWTQVHDSATTALDCLRDGNCYAGQEYGAIYRSTDNGETWERLSDDLTFPRNPQLDLPRKFAMNDRGWIVCSRSWGGNWISLDRGLTWNTSHQVDDSATIRIPHSDILLVTSDSGRVITGYGGTVFVRSANWMHPVTSFAPVLSRNSDVRARAIIEGPSGTLYLGIGTDFYGAPPERLRPDTSGVLVSYDEGSSWKWLRRDIDAMNLMLTADGDLLVSTTLDGFLRVDTADGSSTRLDCGYGYVSDLLFLDGSVLAAMDSCHVTGVMHSRDFGDSWQWSDTMKYTYPNPDIPTRFTILPGGDLMHDYIYRSSDAGKSWRWQPLLFESWIKGRLNSIVEFSDNTMLLSDVNVETGKSFLYPFDDDFHWSAPAYNPGLGKIRQLYRYADDKLFAATENGLFLSSDRGVEWDKILDGDALNVLPMLDGGLIAGLGDPLYSYGYSSMGGGNFVPQSMQSTFSVIDADGDASYLFLLGGHAFDARGEAVTGSGTAILASFDMTSWFSFSLGLPTEEITAICIDEKGYLYAGTRGCGVLRSPIPPAVAVEDIETAALPMSASLYPQPAHGDLTLRVELAHAARLDVAIFDVMGRKLRMLSAGRFHEAGVHQLPVSLEGIPSGNYFLLLSDRTRNTATVLPVRLQ